MKAKTTRVSRAEFQELRRVVAELRASLAMNTTALDMIRRDSAANLRRIAEQQNEIDRLTRRLDTVLSADSSELEPEFDTHRQTVSR